MIGEDRNETKQLMEDECSDEVGQTVVDENLICMLHADPGMNNGGMEQVYKVTDVDVGVQLGKMADVGDKENAEQVVVKEVSWEVEADVIGKGVDQEKQAMVGEGNYQVPNPVNIENEDQTRQSVMTAVRELAGEAIDDEAGEQGNQAINRQSGDEALELMERGVEDGASNWREQMKDYKGTDYAEELMSEVVEDGAAHREEQAMDHASGSHAHNVMNNVDGGQIDYGIEIGGNDEAGQMNNEEGRRKGEDIKIGPGFISAMLKDGSLSAEGLASKGFYVMEDDSEEDSRSTSSDDDTEEVISAGADSDDDSTDSEDEIKSVQEKKVVQKAEGKLNDSEDMAAPRTKNELEVLPPVPKVKAALEPHHQTVCVGHVSSVLDLTVIVKAHSDQNVLNERSILWMETSRKPLGFVDEVFGPVKNPYYLVRFNESEEIPQDATVGSAISYVSEFSDFVLKENPELYKRAVDASGFDDEELGSDEDLEFSDDEKESAARRLNKIKKANGGGDSGPGQVSNKTNGHRVKGTRKENIRSQASETAMVNGVDSTFSQKSSSWQLSRRGHPPRSGRHGNHHRGGRNFPQSFDHEHNTRVTAPSGASRAADYPPSSLLGEARQQSTNAGYSTPQHAMQSPRPQTPGPWKTHGTVEVSPFDSGAMPAMPAQGFSMQQQQSPYPSRLYDSVPNQGYFNPQRQDIPFASSAGSQVNMPAAAFNANRDPLSLAHLPGQGPLSPCIPGYYPGYVPAPYHFPLSNHGIIAQPTLRDMQPGGFSPHLSMVAGTPAFGSGLQAQQLGSQQPDPFVFQSQVSYPTGDDLSFHQRRIQGKQPSSAGRSPVNRNNYRR